MSTTERTPAQIAADERKRQAAQARANMEAELQAAKARIAELEARQGQAPALPPLQIPSDNEELNRLRAENAELKAARVVGQFSPDDQERAHMESMREMHQRAAIEFEVTPKEGLHYMLFEKTHDHDTRLSLYRKMGYTVEVELEQGHMYLLACPIERWEKNQRDEVAKDEAQRRGWKQVAAEDLAAGGDLNGGLAFATVQQSRESVTVTMSN